ncbi:hypothetical protein [Actinobacillus minor]|uniref:Uncharacterized protein n=1 Tax=Actinobacillus minor 202 TaxID=591023 RepID=A0ABM9YTL0_9PAST|nr:hypothetical protein [Actinobacillus minor]EEV24575.1 hypothetical protein AM202_00075 [Actinobacillus minor 202]
MMVSGLTEEQQLDLVRINGFFYEFLENPSERVLQEATKQLMYQIACSNNKKLKAMVFKTGEKKGK